MRAEWMASGACTSGSTAPPRGVTRRASGGAVTTSTSARRDEKTMCPVCIATAVLIAGGVASTGGLAAVAMKKFGVKTAADSHSTSTPSKGALEGDKSDET